MNFSLKVKILIFSLCALLIFLPLNTVLVQFFAVKFGVPIWFSLWKEFLAGVIILISFLEILENAKLKVVNQNLLKIYLPLVLVFLMTLVGILNSLGKVPLNFIIYGFRFELFWVWLWCFLAVLAASKVKWAKFSRYLLNSLLIGFFLTVFFSLVTIIFGVENTLGYLGYGKPASGLGGELLFTQPVGHLIDAGGWNNGFRLSGTFSSPNHFAGYLLLLLPLFLFGALTERNNTKVSNILVGTWFEKLESRGFWWFCLLIDLVFLGLTFARFSYLALFVIFASLSLMWLSKKTKKLKNWFKNFILSIIVIIPVVISVVVLNLPIVILQTNLPSFLAKPSSTEWHQQHTAAAWRALTLQTHPELKQMVNLNADQLLKINNLQNESQNFMRVFYRLTTGYGLGSTDPASKYLPLEQNPIALLGFGLDDELYFPRQIDRPLALTPENWFLGLWVRGGVFYMLLFLAIWLYFMRDIWQMFASNLAFTLENPKTLLQILVSLSLFGLFIGAFLLDIFDSQSFALLIGPIYFTYQVLYQIVEPT